MTLTLIYGKIARYKAGRQVEARCKDPRRVRCDLTRADRCTYKFSGKLVGFWLAWMACAVATHTEHTQKAEKLETVATKGKRSAARTRRCELSEAVQPGTASRHQSKRGRRTRRYLKRSWKRTIPTKTLRKPSMRETNDAEDGKTCSTTSRARDGE